MNINTNYNLQTGFTGGNYIKRPNIVKRAVKSIKNYPNRQKTVVILPDGTIDKSILAKQKQVFDAIIEKILLSMC